MRTEEPSKNADVRGGQPSPAVPAKPALAAYKRKLPHFQKPGRAFFITFVTHRRWVLPPEVRALVLDCIIAGHTVRFQLHAAVVMPDHAHLLLSPGVDERGDVFGLAQIMNSIKGASAHAVNRAMARKGHVWQEESFDTMLRSDESIRQKAEYICANPVRAGLVSHEDEWPWTWREWVEDSR